MFENVAGEQVEQVLAKLAGQLSQAGKSMPTAELRAEITRLHASLNKCMANLAASTQQASQQVAAKREKNAAQAATNKEAIKQARAKLKPPAAPAAAAAPPSPPVDTQLGSELRAELLSRVAAPKVATADHSAKFVLEAW